MRPHRLLSALVAVSVSLSSGCAPFPVVGAFPAATAATTPPTLLPLDELLAQAAAPGTAAARGEALAARAARLRARASLMRGAVHDPATRARLAEAIRQGRA
ncbi:MAG: hypothetical protein IPL38_12195 [Rhodobacter sp.]|nr:hypothetical protein [Rhodobacter sp.]